MKRGHRQPSSFPPEPIAPKSPNSPTGRAAWRSRRPDLRGVLLARSLRAVPGELGRPHRRHRDLLVWGTISSGVLLLPFAFVTEPLRILLAAGAGLGAMATTTAGTVLAIQGQPEPLWDTREAVLQR
jgi:hypothetical protein